MKLGTSTINRRGIGASDVRGGYIGTLSLSQAPDGPEPSAPSTLTEIYKTVGATDLELDIYAPDDSETARTALIFVHGGGWTAGTRTIHADHCQHFAALGVVAINIDYRLVAGAVDLFDQVADVRAAVRWVRENAATYGIDPDKIVLLGESAGGHLAGVAGFIDTFDDAGGNQEVSSRPNSVVLVNPITYLPGIPWYQGHAAQVGATPVPNDLTQLTPASTGADDSLRLSPQLYAAIANQCPALFIHGDADAVVPYAQSEDFHDLLLAAGNESSLVTMPGSDHAFFLPGYGTEGEISATLDAIAAFINSRYSAYALLEPFGDWATWADAPAYSPALTGTIFNVVSGYGADPTGATDSTAAIQNAITAAGVAGGGTVYIPSGLYTVSPTSAYADPGNTGPSCFLLHYSNVTIEGDGPTKTILNHRTFGGGDPNEPVYARGFMFTTLLTPRNVENVTIRGIRATGNAHVTNDAGEYSGIGSTTGWDTTHKFLGIFMQVLGAYSCDNIVVEDCELDNWRGEICYSGGASELGTQFVRRCIIRGSNASSISMGGIVTVEDCWIKAVYNGTECFSLTSGEGLTVTNCVVNTNEDLPSGVTDIGTFGIVYLGVSGASLTVTGCDIGRTVEGGVFLSEAATTVLVENNNFTDTVGIYSQYQNLYPTEPNFQAPEPNKWVDHIYRGNTLTATTRNVPAFVYSLANGGATNWVIEDNTLVKENGFTIDNFINSTGVIQPFTVTGNVLSDGAIPAAIVGPRPWPWNTNTIPGYYTDGQVLFDNAADTTPRVIAPSWPKVNFIDISAMTRRIQVDYEGSPGATPPVPDALSSLPTGFILEIRRTQSNASTRGLEIQPDANWNTLTRGYMIYEGAVLTLIKEAGGELALNSWTPPTANLRTLSETAVAGQLDTSDITMFGQLSVTLAPTVAHVYDSFSGVAVGETVTLNLNGNVTLDHVPGVLEMSAGVDYVSAGTVALSATRAADGTLEVTIP